MAFLDFLRSAPKEAPVAPSPGTAKAATLTRNQKATLESIRRYEGRTVPRLADARRTADESHAEEDEGERLSELRRFRNRKARTAQTVHARFVVRLPEGIVQAIAETKATGISLKAVEGGSLRLDLLKPDAEAHDLPVVIRSYDVTPVRGRKEGEEKAAGGALELRPRARGEGFELVLPPSDATTRRRAPTGVDQGAAQHRLHQLKRRHARRQKKSPPEKLSIEHRDW
jgi:hypothetical protein